ncbi:hypothetical protein CRE_27803 [Caenorhabditis remanei]|uniref:Uncharacterized protein n=1 Tax=Caenorhabditis remanei TaxID=31234 RepID=E3N5K2_CAERE|nr:hypothetical protein CRE_27803 [Caenorhabditis remanei]
MNYLLFFLLISLVNCKGCKDQCECPDLLDRLDWPERGNVSYAEGAGCFRNITCGTSYYYTLVTFNFTESEIYRNDYFNSPAIALSINYEVQTGPNINIFQFFGMICENNEWYITKYPYGINYFTTMAEELEIGANGEFDGKKSKILRFKCELPSK